MASEHAAGILHRVALDAIDYVVDLREPRRASRLTAMALRPPDRHVTSSVMSAWATCCTRTTKSASSCIGNCCFSGPTRTTGRRPESSTPSVDDRRTAIPRACGRRRSSPSRAQPSTAHRPLSRSHRARGRSALLGDACGVSVMSRLRQHPPDATSLNMPPFPRDVPRKGSLGVIELVLRPACHLAPAVVRR